MFLRAIDRTTIGSSTPNANIRDEFAGNYNKPAITSKADRGPVSVSANIVCRNAAFEDEQKQELPLNHLFEQSLPLSESREPCCAENHEPFVVQHRLKLAKLGLDI